MTQRIYLMPIIGNGTDKDPRRPAYAAIDLSNVDWTMMDYGNEPVCIFTADVTGVQHLSLTAHTDVIAVPVNLSNTVGANLVLVQNALSGFNIPSDWVTSGMTYREVVKIVILIFLLAQRIQGLLPTRLFESGITLSSQLVDLSTNARNVLLNAAQSLNIDPSIFTLSMTLRTALKLAADNIVLSQLIFGGQTLI